MPHPGPPPLDEDAVERLLRARFSRATDGPEPEALELVALYVDGATAPSETRRVEAMLAGDADLAEAVRLMRSEPRSPGVSSLAEARAARASRSGRALWGAALALAAGGLLAAGVLLSAGSGSDVRQRATPTVGAGLGLGGAGDHLFVAVARGGAQPVTLAAGDDPPGPGAALSFEVAAARPGQLLIVLLDAEGRVAPLHPSGASRSSEIAASGRAPLPGAVTVPAGSGCAWVVAVFADAPVAVEDLSRAAPASAEGCTLPDLEARWPFARATEAWLIRR